jgi:hypothetical protein
MLGVRPVFLRLPPQDVDDSRADIARRRRLANIQNIRNSRNIFDDLTKVALTAERPLNISGRAAKGLLGQFSRLTEYRVL